MRSMRIGNDLTIVGKVVFAKHFSDFWLASEVGQQLLSTTSLFTYCPPNRNVAEIELEETPRTVGRRPGFRGD